MANYSVKYIDKSYIASIADDVLACNTEQNAIFITLPSIDSLPIGKVYLFKDIAGNANTNNIVISAKDRALIENELSYVMTQSKQAVTLVSTINGWSMMGDANVSTTGGGGGGGDVTGPAGSTNKGIATFAGTSGKVIQNNAVQINGSDILNATIDGVNVNSLNASFTGVSNTVNSLNVTVGNLGTSVSSLSTSVSSISNTVTIQSGIVSSLSTNLISLSATVANSSATLSSLSSTVFSLTATVSAQGSSLVSLSSTVVSLSGTVYNFSSTIASLSTSLITLSGTVSGHTTQISSLSTSLSALSSTVVSLSTYVQSITGGGGASISTVNYLVTKASRWLDVVSDFGADPTGVTDCLAAFNAALTNASLTNYYIGILIPSGRYKLSNTWVIDRPVIIQGAGTNYHRNTTLMGLPGRDVIRVAYQGGPVGGGGQASTIRDLQVQHIAGTVAWQANTSGYSSTSSAVIPTTGYNGQWEGYAGFVAKCVQSGTSGSVEPVWSNFDFNVNITDGTVVWQKVYVAGIKLEAKAHIVECFSTGIGGDGFSVFASTGDSNNANGFKFDHCLSTANIGWGYLTQGADSNSGTFVGCTAYSNGYGGFLERSFLGNYYFGCSSEANGIGKFAPGIGPGFILPQDQPNNCSVAVGFYFETDQTARIYGRGRLISGINETRAYGTGIVEGPLYTNSTYYLNDNNNDGTGDSAYIRVGRQLSQTVLEWGFSNDSFRPLQLGYGVVQGVNIGGWNALMYNGTTSPFAISLSNSSVGQGHFWVPNDLFRGTPGGRVRETTVSGAPPQSGTWTGGDTAIDISPQISGFSKWQCITAGTPGIWVGVPNTTQKIISLSGTISLTQTNTGLCYNNSSTLTITLPTTSTAIVGTWYEFACLDTTGIKINAPGSNVIYLQDQVSAAGGYIQSIAVGSTIKLTYMKTNTWVATGPTGAWSLGP